MAVVGRAQMALLAAQGMYGGGWHQPCHWHLPPRHHQVGGSALGCSPAAAVAPVLVSSTAESRGREQACWLQLPQAPAMAQAAAELLRAANPELTGGWAQRSPSRAGSRLVQPRCQSLPRPQAPATEQGPGNQGPERNRAPATSFTLPQRGSATNPPTPARPLLPTGTGGFMPCFPLHPFSPLPCREGHPDPSVATSTCPCRRRVIADGATYLSPPPTCMHTQQGRESAEKWYRDSQPARLPSALCTLSPLHLALSPAPAATSPSCPTGLQSSQCP